MWPAAIQGNAAAVNGAGGPDGNKGTLTQSADSTRTAKPIMPPTKWTLAVALGGGFALYSVFKEEIDLSMPVIGAFACFALSSDELAVKLQQDSFISICKEKVLYPAIFSAGGLSAAWLLSRPSLNLKFSVVQRFPFVVGLACLAEVTARRLTLLTSSKSPDWKSSAEDILKIIMA